MIWKYTLFHECPMNEVMEGVGLQALLQKSLDNRYPVNRILLPCPWWSACQDKHITSFSQIMSNAIRNVLAAY